MVLLLKNILFTALVPGTVAVYIPLWIAGGAAVLSLDRSLWKIAALLPLLLGAAIYFWCLFNFAVIGRGTPAPIDAPKRLVARGPYRYVRNPMYIGVLLAIAGWAVFFRSGEILLYGAAMGLLFHLFVVLVEEPLLERKFGESYLKYCKDVGRWIPRLSRKRAA